MRFQRLDLNLLVALEVLLSERNVTVASERLHLSQSGMSGALSRLREFFEDELLINRGGRMVLTPRAEELLEPVRAVLMQIKSTITTRPNFQPEESERKFVIMASDYTLTVALAGALEKIVAVAPDLTFEFVPPDERTVERLQRGEADLWITLEQYVSPEYPSELLFEDDYVVVAWKGNTAIKDRISRAQYFDLGHVSSRSGNVRLPTFEAWFLETQPQHRRVEVVAPSFTTAPLLLVGTNRIATMHRRLAQVWARSLPLTIYETPIEIPTIRQVVQWNSSCSSDVGLRWLIDQFRVHMNPLAAAELVHAAE